VAERTGLFYEVKGDDGKASWQSEMGGGEWKKRQEIAGRNGVEINKWGVVGYTGGGKECTRKDVEPDTASKEMVKIHGGRDV